MKFLAFSQFPGFLFDVVKDPGERKDLAATAERVGGHISALLAFSCIGRHWEAASRGIEPLLAGVYAGYPTIGFQSFGEQTGMLLVNCTLTALAIGARA